MPVREVLVYPNRLLKQVAAPVQAGELDDVAADLLETMRSRERCAGLAAPQIGELVRVVAVDVRGHLTAKREAGNQHRGRARLGLDGILFLDRVESLVDDVFRRRSYASGTEGSRSSAGSEAESEKASPAERIG